MARLLNAISQKLAQTDPLVLTGLITTSAVLQYALFYSGMRALITSNFERCPLALAQEDFLIDKVVVGGPDVAHFLTHIAFKLNSDVPKSLLNQLLSAALLSTCILQGRTAAVPGLLGLLGSAAATYSAWTPIVDLYALSAIVRDGNAAAYRRLSLMVLKEQQRDRGKWRATAGYASVAIMSLAILRSLHWTVAFPTTVMYLFAVSF